MLWRRTLWFVVFIVLGGGLAMQAWPDTTPQTRQLPVNGVDLSYLEQGTGTPVVFVHGVPSDLRYWEPQRQAVATQYRFIAVNFRYHGTAPWSDEGQHYSVATHAADLTAFLRQLNVGPVHLVAISYGGFPATLVAVWDSLAQTPGYAAVTHLLRRLFGDAVAESMRAPYVLGDVQALRSLFREAGIADIQIVTQAGTARFPSLQSWVYTDVKGWTAAEMIDDAGFERFLAEAERDLRPFVTPDSTVSFSAPAHIVTTTKAP